MKFVSAKYYPVELWQIYTWDISTHGRGRLGVQLVMEYVVMWFAKILFSHIRCVFFKITAKTKHFFLISK